MHGSGGSSDISQAVISDRDGKAIWKSEAKEIKGKGWQQEQNDLLAALRRGETPNEVEYAARSTMTAILGRHATYSGQLLRWDDIAQHPRLLADVDALRHLDDPPPVKPNAAGQYDLPRPGSRA